jgi:hypothetical protein
MARSIRVRSSFVDFEYDDIHPEEIWDVGYPAYDWCVKVSAWLEKEAKQTAPGIPGTSHARRKARGKSTGHLRAGITAFGHRTGPESFRLVLNSAAYYSEWVHGGTAYARGGFIYSNWGWANKAFVDANIGAWHEGGGNAEHRFGILPIPGAAFMKLPPSLNYNRQYHLRVRGQLPNAFLYRAWNRTNEELAGGEMGSFVEPLGFTRPPGAYQLVKRKV